MEMCEVLVEWLENPIKTKNERDANYEKFYVNNVEVTSNEFIDIEATLTSIIAETAKAIAKELLGKEVNADYDPDYGDYLDIKDENGEVLFSVKVADIEELRTPDSYKSTTTWRPLKDIIKDTIEAIKGYKSTQ